MQAGGNTGGQTDHNQPQNKRTRVLPPTTTSGTGGMVSTDFQVKKVIDHLLFFYAFVTVIIKSSPTNSSN